MCWLASRLKPRGGFFEAFFDALFAESCFRSTFLPARGTRRRLPGEGAFKHDMQ